MLFLADGTTCFPFPGAGTGPVDADDLQRVVLAVMAFGFAEVLSVDAAVRRIQTGSI